MAFEQVVCQEPTEVLKEEDELAFCSAVVHVLIAKLAMPRVLNSDISDSLDFQFCALLCM